MIKMTILGEPASKSNSRKLATIGGRNMTIEGKRTRVGGRAAFIKSDKARAYESDAIRQIPPACRLMLVGPIKITLRIFYASARPDLDESIVLDILQAKFGAVEKGKPRELVRRGVYVNDRQIFEKHVYKTIGDKNPRAEIEVEPLDSQLFVMDAGEEKRDPF